MTTETKAAEAKAQFEAKIDKVKELAEKALGETGKLSEDFKAQIDEALTAVNELKGVSAELEQKLASASAGGKAAPMTAGERFVENEEFKAMAGQARPRGRVVVDVKDISSLTTDAAGSVGALVDADRSPSPVMIPQRRMTIRSLIAPGRTSSSTIEYDREKGFVNQAEMVAEGDQKPESTIQFEDVNAPVRTIAHWMRASVQILADAPALASMIDNRLRYGLNLKEEAQLLNGDGTGQNLEGLTTVATTYSEPSGVSATQLIDTIRFAMLQAVLAEYLPNGTVLNPIDWAVIETLKDGEGRYLIGNPQGVAMPTLWGQPVVPTQAMAEDKFLVGAFDQACQIFDRQDSTVEASTEDGDNFQKNKVTIRGEKRLALAHYRPESLVYGDLGRIA